jgi:hypothetical protein
MPERAGQRITWQRIEEDEIPREVAQQLDALAALDEKGHECWWMVAR